MLSTLRSERTRKYKSMHANLKGPWFTTRCVDYEPLQKLACGWCGRVHPEAWVGHDATLLAGLRDAYQFQNKFMQCFLFRMFHDGYSTFQCTILQPCWTFLFVR